MGSAHISSGSGVSKHTLEMLGGTRAKCACGRLFYIMQETARTMSDARRKDNLLDQYNDHIKKRRKRK
jgi:hypothetical protein